MSNITNSEIICEKMMDLIHDQEYYSSEMFWLDIVSGIYSSYQGSLDGLNLLTRCTKKYTSDKFPSFMQGYESIEKACEHFYFTHEKTPFITVKTLALYASNCNPELFNEWESDYCLLPIRESSDFTDLLLAKVMSNYFWMNLICTDIESCTFMKYNISIRLWENVKDMTLIKVEFEKFLQHQSMLESSLQMIAKIETFIENINVPDKLQSYINILSHSLYEPYYTSIMNCNTKLTSVKNGVLEVFKNDLVFRMRKPEDYFSNCTDVNYKTDLSWKDQNVIKCFQCLREIFPRVKDLHHFLVFCSSGLTGSNKQNICMNWYHNANNDKSICLELLYSVYGFYCINIPSELWGNYKYKDYDYFAKKSLTTRFIVAKENSEDINTENIEFYTNTRKHTIKFHNTKSEIESTPTMIVISDDQMKVLTKDRQRSMAFDNDMNSVVLNDLDTTAFLWILCEYFRLYATEKL